MMPTKDIWSELRKFYLESERINMLYPVSMNEALCEYTYKLVKSVVHNSSDVTKLNEEKTGLLKKIICKLPVEQYYQFLLHIGKKDDKELFTSLLRVSQEIIEEEVFPISSAIQPSERFQDAVNDSDSTIFISDDEIEKMELEALLRTLRTRISKEKRIPTYCIMRDEAIKAIAYEQPKDIIAFRDLKGIGNATAKTYGPIFINLVNRYLDYHN